LAMTVLELGEDLRTRAIIARRCAPTASDRREPRRQRADAAGCRHIRYGNAVRVAREAARRDQPALADEQEALAGRAVMDRERTPGRAAQKPLEIPRTAAQRRSLRGESVAQWIDGLGEVCDIRLLEAVLRKELRAI